MIDVWGIPIMAEVEDVVDFLATELHASGSHLLSAKKVTGRNIMYTCINHAGGTERKPSMGITTEDIDRDGKITKAGAVNCFTCGYTADLPEFVSNCFGLKDAGYQGFKWITSHFVNLAIENRRDIELDMSRNRTRSDELRAGIGEVELASYRFTHPYMYERKLTDKVIDYFDVGYDRETKCLTFPVHDLRGVPLFLQRRAVKGKRFQNDVTTLKGNVLYGLYHVYRNLEWIEELYVTESIIDALTLWTRRKAAVATMQAIPTVTQLEMLRKVPIRKIINAQDNDKAGYRGAYRIKDALGDHKLIYRADFPTKDINLLYEDEIDNIQSYLL